MRIHTGEKSFKCTFCDKAFAQSEHIKRHMRIHTGEKPFMCTFCDKAFTQSEHIKRHMRIHTGEKPFKCKSCDRAFATNYALVEHMRMHTGEKPFKCNFCHKAFTRPCALSRHLRIHTGEKPFKCRFCHKSFTQSGTMKEHSRIHTGEKPFKCTACGKKFTNKSGMFQHLKRFPRGKCKLPSKQQSYISKMGTPGAADHLKYEIASIDELPSSPENLIGSSVTRCKIDGHKDAVSGSETSFEENSSAFIIRAFGCGFYDEMFDNEGEFMKHCSRHAPSLPSEDTYPPLQWLPEKLD